MNEPLKSILTMGLALGLILGTILVVNYREKSALTVYLNVEISEVEVVEIPGGGVIVENRQIELPPTLEIYIVTRYGEFRWPSQFSGTELEPGMILDSLTLRNNKIIDYEYDY